MRDLADAEKRRAFVCVSQTQKDANTGLLLLLLLAETVLNIVLQNLKNAAYLNPSCTYGTAEFPFF